MMDSTVKADALTEQPFPLLLYKQSLCLITKGCRAPSRMKFLLLATVNISVPFASNLQESPPTLPTSCKSFSLSGTLLRLHENTLKSKTEGCHDL